MTAREKIEQLTNAWYGFAFFAAALSLVQNGIGFLSLLGAGFSLVVSVGLSWFLGRRLLARSSLTRVLLVVVAAIGMVLGALGAAKLGWKFLGGWKLSALVGMVLAAGSAWMNIRSLRVLTDQSVKTYID
jgi:hypothetical protein